MKEFEDIFSHALPYNSAPFPEGLAFLDESMFG